MENEDTEYIEGNGDDFLKYQARINPNRRFTGPFVKY